MRKGPMVAFEHDGYRIVVFEQLDVKDDDEWDIVLERKAARADAMGVQPYVLVVGADLEFLRAVAQSHGFTVKCEGTVFWWSSPTWPRGAEVPTRKL